MAYKAEGRDIMMARQTESVKAEKEHERQRIEQHDKMYNEQRIRGLKLMENTKGFDMDNRSEWPTVLTSLSCNPPGHRFAMQLTDAHWNAMQQYFRCFDGCWHCGWYLEADKSYNCDRDSSDHFRLCHGFIDSERLILWQKRVTDYERLLQAQGIDDDPEMVKLAEVRPIICLKCDKFYNDYGQYLAFWPGGDRMNISEALGTYDEDRLKSNLIRRVIRKNPDWIDHYDYNMILLGSCEAERKMQEQKLKSQDVEESKKKLEEEVEARKQRAEKLAKEWREHYQSSTKLWRHARE